MLLPSTLNSAPVSWLAKAWSAGLLTWAQGVVVGMPAAMTKRSQRRWGMATGLKVVTCLRAFCSRTTERALIKVSRVWGGVQLSEIGNA